MPDKDWKLETVEDGSENSDTIEVYAKGNTACVSFTVSSVDGEEVKIVIKVGATNVMLLLPNVAALDVAETITKYAKPQ